MVTYQCSDSRCHLPAGIQPPSDEDGHGQPDGSVEYSYRHAEERGQGDRGKGREEQSPGHCTSRSLGGLAVSMSQ